MIGVASRFYALMVVLVLALAGCNGDETAQENSIETPTIPELSAIPDASDRASHELTVDIDPTSYTDYLSHEDDESEPVFKELKKVTVKYDKGSVKRKFQQKVFENGDVRYHGEFSEWWDNGELWKKGRFEDGKQAGEWKFFTHDEGTLAKQGSYIDGRPDGDWTYFRKDGTRQRIESYADGQRNGVWIEFDLTGEFPMQEFNFLDGKRHGPSTKWFPPKKGEKVRRKYREIEYDEGRQHGKASEWYATGQIKTEIHFKGGKRHGRAAQWDPSGSRVNAMNFKDGELVKPQQEESSPGKPKEKPAGD